MLVQHGADVDTRTKDDETPLILSVSNDQVETMKFLLQQGTGAWAFCLDRFQALMSMLNERVMVQLAYFLLHILAVLISVCYFLNMVQMLISVCNLHCAVGS